MESEKIKIYRLLEAEELIKHEDVLPKLLFDLPENKQDYDFSISPISGWLYYVNTAEIRKNENIRLLPQDEKQVKQVVADFLQKVNTNLGKQRKKDKDFKINRLFPTILGKPQISPVINADNELPDHVLARFQPMLRGTTGYKSRPMPIIGAVIDFRIGNRGKIIGVSSNWRPTNGSSEELMIDLPFHDEEIDHPTEHHEEDVPVMCYREKGEDIHQNFLTPFFLDAGGHHYDFDPASQSSMDVTIAEVPGPSGSELFAVIRGGYGKYRFEWSSWTLDDLDDSFRELGRNASTLIGVGAHTVALTVIDQKTGIIEQTLSSFYIHEKEVASAESTLA